MLAQQGLPSTLSAGGRLSSESGHFPRMERTEVSAFRRIDDLNGIWKGRGEWRTSGDRTPWLKEGGKGTVLIAFHFQFRPNPLAD